MAFTTTEIQQAVDPHELDKKAEVAITKCVINLLLNDPFFGQLVSRLDVVIEDDDSWCKTMATDGRHLFANRTFVLQCKPLELLFGLAHEVVHCMLDHVGRRGTREAKLWNYAADFIVNYILTEAKIGMRRASWLYDKRFTDEMTVEEVYSILLRQSTEVEIEFPDMENFDHHLDAAGSDDDEENEGSDSGDGDDDGDDGDGNQQGSNKKTPKIGGKDGSNKVKVRVMGKKGPPKLTKQEIEGIRDRMISAAIQAAQVVGAGKVPAGIMRMLGALIEPKLDWRSLLDSHIRSAFRSDYTFQRMNRRDYGDIILPTSNILMTVEVDIAIDASGSMTNDMLRDIFSEVKGIMETFPSFKLRVWTFDTKVYNCKQFTQLNIDEISDYAAKAHGGGGTLFECNWVFMREQGIVPHRLVVFTDGYPCDSWGDPNYCDTLFVIHGDPHQKIRAPWGTTAWYEAPEQTPMAA